MSRPQRRRNVIEDSDGVPEISANGYIDRARAAAVNDEEEEELQIIEQRN